MASQLEHTFSLILERNAHTISRICSAYATRHATREDLYQECALSIWRGLESFRGNSALSTWLYRVCINTCISYLRRHSRPGDDYSLDTCEQMPVDEDHAIYSAEDSARLNELIHALPPVDKAILLLWLDEKSYKEIAAVVGIKSGAVGTRLNRIRLKLQKQFLSGL